MARQLIVQGLTQAPLNMFDGRTGAPGTTPALFNARCDASPCKFRGCAGRPDSSASPSAELLQYTADTQQYSGEFTGQRVFIFAPLDVGLLRLST